MFDIYNVLHLLILSLTRFRSVFTEKVVEMLTPLKNIEAMEKDTVTFTCELSKPDRKDGKWKHLGKEITPKTKR